MATTLLYGKVNIAHQLLICLHSFWLWEATTQWSIPPWCQFCQTQSLIYFMTLRYSTCSFNALAIHSRMMNATLCIEQYSSCMVVLNGTWLAGHTYVVKWNQINNMKTHTHTHKLYTNACTCTHIHTNTLHTLHIACILVLMNHLIYENTPLGHQYQDSTWKNTST